MIYIFYCNKCGKTLDLVQKMNSRHQAYHCGVRAQRIFTVPYTRKDLMYNFLDTNTFKEPVQIHSKRQYNRLLKTNGLVQVAKDDLKEIKPPDPKPRIRKFAKKMADKIHKEGAMSWVTGKTNPNGRDKL